MQTYSSTNYNVRDKISNYQKSRIENQNIDKNKLIRDVPLKCNNKRLLLTKICSFIQKIRCRFKYRSIRKNNLDVKPSMNVLISLYGNIDEHKISEKISLTETVDVGKMMNFDTLQESLIDIDMIFNNLISKIDQSMSSLQIEKPDSNLDDSLEPFDLKHDHNTLSTITTINNYLPQLSGNKITIFSDYDLDFDQQLISDFSVLSKLITIILPPPRSSKRPIIKDNENAKKFYYEKIEFKNFIDKLKLKFTNVIIHDDSSKPCSNNGNRNNLSNCLDKKKVNFSQNISLCKTYTDNEYDRSDPNVTCTLQALKNPEYVQSLKSEINEFKHKEMTVHEGSMLFTHFI